MNATLTLIVSAVCILGALLIALVVATIARDVGSAAGVGRLGDVPPIAPPSDGAPSDAFMRSTGA